MKKLFLMIFFTASANCFLPVAAQADMETNNIYLKVMQASNNVQDIIRILPDVEKLWPQHPDVYLRSANHAAHVLGSALGNPNAKQAFINVFTNIMLRPMPTNEGQAIVWLGLKRDIIGYYLNFDDIKDDQSRWLEIARFTGEIHSKIIPNYKRKGMLLDGFGFTPQEIEQNKENLIQDRYQTMLLETDRTLVFFLQGASTYFPSSNPTNADFIKQISDAAHLTDEERKKLEGP